MSDEIDFTSYFPEGRVGIRRRLGERFRNEMIRNPERCPIDELSDALGNLDERILPGTLGKVMRKEYQALSRLEIHGLIDFFEIEPEVMGRPVIPQNHYKRIREYIDSQQAMFPGASNADELIPLYVRLEGLRQL